MGVTDRTGKGEGTEMVGEVVEGVVEGRGFALIMAVLEEGEEEEVAGAIRALVAPMGVLLWRLCLYGQIPSL
jgi:hypothetical protein